MVCLAPGSESFQSRDGGGADIILTLLGSGVDMHICVCRGCIVLCIHMQPCVHVNVHLLVLVCVFK